MLDQLKSAAAQVADFKNSCSDTYALTPPGRLRAMTSRISALAEAVRTVRLLEAFYNALSDEQPASRWARVFPTSEDQLQQEATRPRARPRAAARRSRA